MTQTPLNFELPASTSATQFISKLNKEITVQLVRQQQCKKTYFDSFDWRLFANGIVCDLNQSDRPSVLSLTDLSTGQNIATLKLEKTPVFVADFNRSKIRKRLQATLEMRALLPIATVKLESYHLNILNKHEKTVVRLLIEQHEGINNRVTLLPVKGYDKALARIAGLLQKKLGLNAVKQTVLVQVLANQETQPLQYSSKLNIPLTPDMPADSACKIIFRHLLKTIKVNEPGTIEDIDSEFLHDFRVAIRRTRAGLNQFKSILNANNIAKFVDNFAWLGEITSPTRDMDVYLLNFDHYKNSLPIEIREDLNPLHDFLIDKQQTVQKTLARHLQSAKYRSVLSSWQHYLDQPEANTLSSQIPAYTIKELADSRIWKVYKHTLKQGNAINDDSPAAALHDLRKTCKKLRYLMEFFQSLYPQNQIKSLIKNLKGFQEVLGDFQDYEVQETALKQFSEEMVSSNKIPVQTFLAMGVLIQDLDKRRQQARQEFAKRFMTFKQAEHQTAFALLFSGNK